MLVFFAQIPNFTRILQGSLRDVDDFTSRGCRKLERVNTGVPMYMSVVSFTCVVPQLYCADAVEIQRKFGLELVPR